MTSAEFKKKWSRYSGKESSAYQEHFNDLCRLLGHPTPVEADPSGNDFFCFQKGVIKEMGALAFSDDAGGRRKPKKGWADVWKKDCFGWEYKGKHKNLEEAYDQLKQYRESLLNPPLFVVCDFERFIIQTNFNGTVPEVHEFTNDQIDRPDVLRLLDRVFNDPGYLKPQRTTHEVTKELAALIAEVARSLQSRESVEWADAKSRDEVRVAQKKNLRIARFLNRIIFCFFAEDTRLLPKNLFKEICKASLDDPKHFAISLESLFQAMAHGGVFGPNKIRHFNGHLFEEATVFELTAGEIAQLADAAEADWRAIEPSIMGTLFERAIDERQRAQLGAHYTSREDIETLVEPVLMAPLRREWAELKRDLLGGESRGRKHSGRKSEPPNVGSYVKKVEAFQKKLASTTVLDPACGSGNFLYVSLQLLLGLEKEVINFAAQLDLDLKPQVNVQQLKAIEINPYAFELAQVSVQIGYLQWMRDNGFPLERSPVLQNLDGFENKDALLNQTFRKKPKSLKEAQDQEHAGDETVKVYTERAWPACDVIVSNPPFLGDKLMRGELGDHYVEELRRTYGDRIPGQSDLCCYWFEKARDLIEHGKCRRAGLLATQGIRGGGNREVLKHIKKTGDIFFAESDREWILEGANVHVSMVGFDAGMEVRRILDGRPVAVINTNLTSAADLASAKLLKASCGVAFIGTTKGGSFDVAEAEAIALLNASGNPNGKPNSDVIKPILNGFDILRRKAQRWLIDNEAKELPEAAAYEGPHRLVVQRVKPDRDANRDKWLKENWWRLQRMRPEMRSALAPLDRFIATPRVAKHRVCCWFSWPMITDDQTVVFARSDDYFFGVVHSRIHGAWALRQGTRLETRPRYTPTTCFETFPFPFPDDLLPPKPPPAKPPPAPRLKPEPEPDRTYAEMMAAHFYSAKEEPAAYGSSPKTPDEHRAAIAAAAKELNELRERWLNPPEWTVEKVLEFPGSVNGPWARLIDSSTVNPMTGVGTVRYLRLEPRDADSAAKLKKRTLTSLYNERPAWLDLAHRRLDASVASAYGWADLIEILTQAQTGVIYDFTTGSRTVMQPSGKSFEAAIDRLDQAVNEQILKRLLDLNLERASAEARATKEKQPRIQRGKMEDELI